MMRLMCCNPAKLCGLQHRKGLIAKGFDADFCIWDPSDEFVVSLENTFFKNKMNPYLGRKLRGVVHATVVGGEFAFVKGGTFAQVGELIKSKSI